MSKGVQIALAATAIAGLFGWYGSTRHDASASFTYYESLAAFQANADASAGARARIHGFVEPSSIRRDVAAMQVRFRIQNTAPHAGGESGRALEVVLASLETPDLFKDGAEVVVEGRLAAGGGASVFEADKVLAKCPSKFEAKPVDAAES
ncbi:MAG TPA: cytochrome c maturation protein CcmE [Myxococcota bacterium]|nr:cytochrome c maturation protein CcmE [Myxococcota bacterium]